MRSFDNQLLLTADELKNKQSVRATFRISQQAIDLMTFCAGLLGIKQKSLFDQLVDDTTILERLAEKAQEDGAYPDRRRQQKTFVLSRNSLRNLNRTAKDQNIPRDLLVEMSIDRLVPIISQEKEQQQKRKKLLALLAEYYHKGQKLLVQAEQLMGPHDTSYGLLKEQIEMQGKAINTLEEQVQRGEAMEDHRSCMQEEQIRGNR